MTHINPTVAFEQAIYVGVLDTKQGSERYAGRYMYMGSEVRHGELAHGFKHIVTRRYIWVPAV